MSRAAPVLTGPQGRTAVTTTTSPQTAFTPVIEPHTQQWLDALASAGSPPLWELSPEDARQLVDSAAGTEQLKARVHLASALAARLAVSLAALSRDARRVRQAVEIANEAIARAQARL